MPLIIVFLAFIFRLISINQSLWLDEAISLRVVSQFSFSGIIKSFSPLDFHPPNYYLLLKLWTGIFTDTVISARVLSVIFSLAAGIYLYHLVKNLLDSKAAVWSLSLFLFNPLILYYSQEVRMYSLLVFLLLAVTYYFFQIIQTPTRRSTFILFNIFTFLSFLTFYGSVFLIITFIAYSLINPKLRPHFYLLTPGIIIALITISPLLFTQYQHSSFVLNNVQNWSLSLGRVTFKNLLLIPIKFVTGRVSFYPKILYYITAFLSVVITCLSSAKGFQKNRLLLFLFFTPLVIATIFSFFSPMLQYFRFLYLIPFICIALSYQKKYFILPIFLIFVAFSLFYLFDSNQHREGWKNLSQDLNSQYPVFMVSSFADPILYYRPQTQIIGYDQETRLPATGFITVVPYGEDIHGLDHTSILSRLGFSQVNTINYHQISAEVWQKN